MLISCLRVRIYVLQPRWMLKQFITLKECVVYQFIHIHRCGCGIGLGTFHPWR